MTTPRKTPTTAPPEPLSPLRAALILWALLIVLLFMIQPSTSEILYIAVLELTGGGA